MTTPGFGPDTRSSAYASVADAWRTIDDILAGPVAIRGAGERYLPKYSAEGPKEYERRLKQSPWRPEFADILASLSSKPFGKDVALVGEVPSQIKAVAEDVDKKGHNLTVFARGVFRGAIARREHGILVDFPSMAPARTIAEERQAGVSPYWVSIPATDILACTSEFVGGREVVTYLRFQECLMERDGFGEIEVKRIRVIEPRRWEVWEKRGNATEYAKMGEGVTTLDEVPFVRFIISECPPLEALADMQIELYRALSRQEEILTYAGSPMLCAKGIAAPGEGKPPLEVGPKRVLFAPPGQEGRETGWSYIQPDAANLKEIRDSVDKVIEDMRRLGMQPLTQRSGGVTATATSVEAAKAHSAVQAWAIALKDALEQAFVFTAKWLKQPETVEVDVNTDFSVEPYAQAPLDALAKARENGDISRGTYWDGLRRFDVLSPDFDPEAEIAALEEEAFPADGEEDERAALGG